MSERISPLRLALESAAAFAIAFAFLMALAPSAPFTKELGVCESGAVRDVLAGNIILPHFIPGPMVHVPPLYWWMAALAVKAWGWTELALRLPALVPAALTCAIIYGWATVRLSRDAALWAAAALLFGHFFLDAARQPRMDAMLALFVTAAIIALDALLRSRSWWWAAAAALLIGLGCLSKGILGIALPGIVVVVYLIARKRFFDLFRLELIAAFSAGLVIGLGWYVAAYQIAGEQFLKWQVGMNLWSRFVPAEAGGANYCVHPFWYFGPVVANGMLPWTLYLPALALLLWPRPRRIQSEAVTYALCWFVAILGFFSISRGKCEIYILPALPPLALLLGWTISWTRLADSPARLRCAPPSVPTDREEPVRRGFLPLFSAASLVTALGALAMVAGATLVLIHGPLTPPLKLHPTDRRFLEIFNDIAAQHDYRLLNWMVLSGLGGLVIIWGIIRRRTPLQPFGVLLIAVAGARFWFGVMNPALAGRETLKTFAHDVMDVVPAHDAIGHIGIEDCDLYFYSSRPITPIFHFRCDDPAFPPYIVIRKKRLEAMPAATRACLSTVLISAPVDSNGPRLLVQQLPIRP